jgi:hypothetical protein
LAVQKHSLTLLFSGVVAVTGVYVMARGLSDILR